MSNATDLGMRQRKTSSSPDDKSKTTTTGESTEIFVHAMAEKAPASIKPYLQMCAPYLGTAANIIQASIPYFQMAYVKGMAIWEALQPYRPTLLLPAFCGLIMCFFGGSFFTLIAAVEAYRMCGYETSVQCVKDIYTDFTAFAEANKEDDSKDDDNDGIADVKQRSKQELLTRKTLLFLKTVDPKRLTMAISGLNAGFLAVVATLKLQFAKAITLGSAIGSILDKYAQAYVAPVLEAMLPAEYKKWARPLIEYSVKSFAISVAWFIQRVLSAFHSAVRGGLMFSRNIMEYTTEMKYYVIDHETTIIDEVVGYALAAVGLWFQLSMGFSLPFPLNILLFPFSLAEYFLMWVVNSK